MKVSKLIALSVLAIGACDEGDEGTEVAAASQQVVAAYSGFSDSTNGGTQGFFLFSPFGATAESTVFAGTHGAFPTSRVKAQVVNIDCNTGGPSEGSLVATLNTNLYVEKYQVSRNIGLIGTGLITGNCYRVKPTLDGFAMGFSDFQVTSGTAPAPFRRVTPGSNLTVKWRMETALNTDTDLDTVPDWRDNCPTVPNTNQDPSVCAPPADSDNDTIPDNLDNCVNTPNTDQANVDGDSAGDACDGCPTDSLKTAAGVCGCGVVEDTADGDSDGTVNCLDACPANPFKETSAGHCGCDEIDADTNENGQIDVNDQCGVCSGS
jgi:hypothetical protein